ncbi:MAG: 1-acyl-sn-glycerol-3-phosphate acyltransferase, partial [Sediminibacterium sp.]
MIYRITQVWIRLALKIFIRRISWSDNSVLKSEGPLLLACNHPNSFLDAIIIGSMFDKPVHYLTRGDAFRNPLARKILQALKLIPIYRLSEGREYLALNDATFDQCKTILSLNGILLIFSEGLCINQWDLRPLKKGTARIALDAMSAPNIQEKFRVLPVSINYHSFRSLGKRMIVHFGSPITNAHLPAELSDAERINYFNSL